MIRPPKPLRATSRKRPTSRGAKAVKAKRAAVERITPALVAAHGLAPDEYERIRRLIGRAPGLTELGIFSAMWNEHCSYKSSKIHLRSLPTSAPWVIQGPGENAGVIDIGDGLAVVFKMESHNHPSYIEPYQGAATGVGGIMRDVFTMGARPVALLNALRFGDPSHPKTKRLVEGVVAGIAGYGNCVGVPTVAGETNFHTCLEAEAAEVALLLPGHFASERFGVEALVDVIQAIFPRLTVWASRAEQDPLRWVARR